MKVNFYATLRQIAGTKTVEFPLAEKATVRQLVVEIVERYPAMHPVLLNSNGALYGHVHVFINGRDVPFLQQTMDTVLTIDDKVDVFPAIGGG